MKSAFDPHDLLNSFFDFTAAEFNSIWPLGGDNPPPPTPALTGEAIQAMAAQVGATSTVIVSSLGVGVYNPNGFNMNLVFDAAATAAPASFRQGIEQAATILAQNISNKITVNIKIDYSGTGGGAAAGPDNGQYVSYSTVRTDLIADATPGDTTFNALPKGSTIQGQSQVAVWNAQLKAFGLLSPNSTTTDDGSATFATDIDPNLLVGVALHELTHAMGRVPYGSQPDIFDFFRFTSAGNYLFTDNIPAAASYFSLNGGVTKIAGFGQNSDPSDFLNSPASNLTPNDPFDEYYSNNTSSDPFGHRQGNAGCAGLQPGLFSTCSKHRRFRDVIQGGPGRGSRYASERYAYYYGCGPFDFVGRNHQDREWQRERGRRRPALRQRRAERLGRQWRHRELERQYRYPDIDRKRHACRLRYAAEPGFVSGYGKRRFDRKSSVANRYLDRQ